MTIARHTGVPRGARRGARGLALVAALVLLGAAAPVAAQIGFYAVEIEPEQPRAQQAVYATVAVPFNYALSEVTHVQGVIEIGVRAVGGFLPRPGTRPMSVTLGKLPQGTYQLRVVNADAPTRPALSPARVLTIAPPEPSGPFGYAEPLMDFSGWWTRADSDSGEGWLVEHKVPDRMMFAWVTYDDAGNPNWFVMQSTLRQSGSLIGPVYHSRREGGTIVRTLVGEGRFRANGPDAAVFALRPVDPAQAPVDTPLRRLAF